MLSRFLILLLLIVTASAGTIYVTIGNTDCRTKQLTVQRLWKSMPGVRSVLIVPRKSGDLPNQRVFMVSTNGADPDRTALTLALGNRAGRYPILSLAPSLFVTR